MPLAQPDQVQVLRETVTDEILRAIGLSPSGWLRKLLVPVLRPAANGFTRALATIDHDTSQYGFGGAARQILPWFVLSCRQYGAEAIPTTGPLLVASNHPGATDALVIAASLPREDLKLVISDAPVVRALIHLHHHLIYAGTEVGERARTVRETIGHLQNGGAVLLFPGGYPDPDPAFLANAEGGLIAWSRSVALLLRHVPETRLVPTIVGGVLEPGWLSHPLTWLAPKGWQRQKLAEILQLAQQLMFKTRCNLHPRVTFGDAVPLAALESPPGDLMQTILDRTRRVLELHLGCEGRASPVPLPTRRLG